MAATRRPPTPAPGFRTAVPVWLLAPAVTACCLLAVPAAAQNQAPLYRIEKEGRAHVTTRDRRGAPTLYITVQFKITRGDGQLANDIEKDEIIVVEDGRRVEELDIHQPAAHGALTTVLAIDISGSMGARSKITQAQEAARVFLHRLHARADCGLILFDHRIRVTENPVRDRQRFLSHRLRLNQLIQSAQPLGGTAYLDATAQAVHMLGGVKGRKAILLLTDGVDLNSRHTLDQVIRLAQAAEVPVYTLGVGEPGKQEPVTTVLVLDRSGSMGRPADTRSRMTKIRALHEAAGRFVDLMRPGARTTLLPFGDEPERPEPFTADKELLKAAIHRLHPLGQTALFNATYDAVMTLEAERPRGKRAVVVLTDGINNRGPRRVEDVIELARGAEVPLHMLGFGRPGELDHEVMQRMARETRGTYHHASDEQRLFEIFENLSIQLHDDGIDEAVLRKLANATGGKYYPARDVARLPLIYRELAEELQNTYTVKFPSQRPSHDGTSRGIDISVVRRGVRVSEVASFDYSVHGVVVPEMDHRVYLGLLALLGGLLALPQAVRRLYRSYGGT